MKEVFRYKRTVSLVLACIILFFLFLRFTLVKSVRLYHENLTIREELNAKDDRVIPNMTEDKIVNIQCYAVDLISFIKEGNCSLLKLDIGNKKGEKAASMQELNLAFTGSYGDLVEVLHQIEENTGDNMTTMSCGFEVERPDNKKDFSLVVRLKIIVHGELKVAHYPDSFQTRWKHCHSKNIPDKDIFDFPAIKAEVSKNLKLEKKDRKREPNKRQESLIQARYVGMVGSHSKEVLVLEIEGAYHWIDCNKGISESCRLVKWQAQDSLIVIYGTDTLKLCTYQD